MDFQKDFLVIGVPAAAAANAFGCGCAGGGGSGGSVSISHLTENAKENQTGQRNFRQIKITLI